MADVITLADRRPKPAADPFAGAAEVVTFDLDRRATRPVVDRSSLDSLVERTADRIAILEGQVALMRETNDLLMEVLVGLLTEARGRRLAEATVAAMGGPDAKI